MLRTYTDELVTPEVSDTWVTPGVTSHSPQSGPLQSGGGGGDGSGRGAIGDCGGGDGDGTVDDGGGDGEGAVDGGGGDGDGLGLGGGGEGEGVGPPMHDVSTLLSGLVPPNSQGSQSVTKPKGPLAETLNPAGQPVTKATGQYFLICDH